MSLKKKKSVDDKKSKVKSKEEESEKDDDLEDEESEEESEEEDEDSESDEESDEEEEDESDEEDDDDSSSEDEETDLDEELERERGGKNAKDAFKQRQKRREETDDDEEDDTADDEDDDDKPITRGELRRIEARAEKRTNRERAQEIAGEMASSPKEGTLIFEIWKNRTFPTHLNLREQIEEAYAIANRKPLLAKNREMRRALRGKDNARHDTAGSHRDSPDSTKPKQSKGDANAYARAGFKFDSKRKIWTKKLPNGKRLLKDPKTKQQWTE